uniref:Uncharacterized protein n=1 Tax=Anguilla anguilla TaxID=7936 RepID=A0A0E9Y2M6_ANGAN
MHRAKTPSLDVNGRDLFMRVLQLKVKICEHEEDKLLQLIGGEEAAWAHADPSTPGHVVVSQLFAVLVEIGLFAALWCEKAVVLEGVWFRMDLRVHLDSRVGEEGHSVALANSVLIPISHLQGHVFHHAPDENGGSLEPESLVHRAVQDRCFEQHVTSEINERPSSLYLLPRLP